jgi:ribose-phosphate pyrophosphokinase
MISHGKEVKVFTANANPAFAQGVCKELGIKLGDSSVTEFADGEVSVSINETVRGADVFVVQSTCKPVNDHLMELLVMIDAFKRASAGRITAVIPYYGYARQDRKAKARDPISAKLVANLITAAGADRVLTMDLHASQIQGFGRACAHLRPEAGHEPRHRRQAPSEGQLLRGHERHRRCRRS